MEQRIERREFIVGLGALPYLSVFGGIGISSAAKAQVAEAAALSSTFSLISGVAGFLSRGTNPTVPILISLAQSLDAMNIKIDGVSEKLDILLEQVSEIRSAVANIPQKTQLLGYMLEMREPWQAFLELNPSANLSNPSSSYLRSIPNIVGRIQTARRLFMSAINGSNEPAFEGVVELALAQDSEINMSLEMLRTEMIDSGMSIDPAAIIQALKYYEEFFSQALDEEKPSSITNVKKILEQKIREYLNRDVTITPDQYRAAPAIGMIGAEATVDRADIRKRIDALNGVTLQAQCGFTGDICAMPSPSSGCLEPGWRTYYFVDFRYQRTVLPSEISQLDEQLKFPFLHEVVSDYSCEGRIISERDGARATISRDALQVKELNLLILRYYRVHYIHSLCDLALSINRRHQKNILSIIA